ncbi:MAG: formylglycine-generating enzyme family protein [Brasilonema octagenarum HA4186-MV1]|jgi:formylglycine-generating enzyme required for sulfatase activity|nr:formylglycine-generating enzyme family protein [Brasilonema octagenarum HA4186-MV1]
MTIPDQLIAILERILDGNRDERDITLLRQWLKTSSGQNLVQSGNYIVNIAEGKEIHIGDRTYYGTDAKTIKAVLREVLPEIIQSIAIEKSLQENAQISHPSNFSPQTTSENLVTTNSQKLLIPPPPPPKITTFEFEVVTVDTQGRETKRCGKQAEYFIENLGGSVLLEMVSIPEGKFQMGAPLDESESLEDERPQHIITLQSFFMSRYPITQAQWRAIAILPKIKHHLNPGASCFKGDNLPVERVSWHDAHEFCERLSRETGRKYRLPSEAEWEYACRARTSTPFHFGKTITTNLANYCGQNENINRVHRQQTTEVGSFPANAFGLCDLHGLVWEWCADYEHEDYQNAPSNGSAWLNDGNSEYRILRGGSWDSFPRFCRSASRFSSDANTIDKEFGFRVVCC